MGQYYRIFTQNSIGAIQVFNNRVYFPNGNLPTWMGNHHAREDEQGKYLVTGYKLMEHSWMDDYLAEAFSYHLWSHHPMRVVWVGDYAEPYECVKLGFNHAQVWGHPEDDDYVDAEITRLCYPSEEQKKNFNKFKFFVNETKKLYLDLDKYKYECVTADGCIYPVSLLTALGNGRGLGDFHKGCVGYEHVGTWAGDYVTIQEEKPDNYEEVTIKFIEKMEK